MRTWVMTFWAERKVWQPSMITVDTKFQITRPTVRNGKYRVISMLNRRA